MISQEYLQSLATSLVEQDPLTWGQIFFPNHFLLRTPGFHHEMLEAAMNHRYLAIASPRGSAKSTLLVFLYPFHQIVFKERSFILIISNTFKKAAMYLDSIKKEVIQNEVFRNMFRIKLTRDAEGDTIFAHPDGFETLVLCKGVDQIGSVRGVKFGPNRPDLIVCDDIEDDELVKNPLRRQELQQEYDEALVPAGEQSNCQYIAIGTLLHDDSQLAKLISKDHYPEYYKMIFKAHLNCDSESEESLWPEKWSLEDLKLLRKEKPNVYAKEMQNDPVAGSNTRFRREDFRYWKIEGGRIFMLDDSGHAEKSYDFNECRCAVSCDLAWKEKRESDSSVIMPGFITPHSEILVDTYINKKGLRPDETSEQLFLMVERLEKLTGSTVPVGFEKAMLENVTQWLLKREMQKRGKFLLTKELVWDTDKNTRIETRLQPRYSQHVIYHKQGMGDLEYQLERFPYGTHDDLCLAEGTLIATIFGNKPIEEIKVGDLVITPSGLQRVNGHLFTGYKPIISKFGLEATNNHLIISKNSCIISIDELQEYKELFKLDEVLQWRYKKLLNSMESNTDSWVARESITSVNQRPILEGKIRKDFMWRFGNFILNKKFQKAVTFIIKMATLLTIASLTLSAFQAGNMIENLKKSIKNWFQLIFRELDLLQKFGIVQRKVGSGTAVMLYNLGKIENLFGLNAIFASKILNQNFVIQNTAHSHAGIRKNGELRKVYSLSVENEKVYYANGILVSNCDSLQGLVQLLQYPKSQSSRPSGDDEFMRVRQIMIDRKNPPRVRHRYQGNDRRFPYPLHQSFR